MRMHMLRSWTYGVTIWTAAFAAALFVGCTSDDGDPLVADAGLADASLEAAVPSDGGEDVGQHDGSSLDDGGADPDVDAGPCSADGWCQTELTSPNLEAVWGSGPNDVWAVGWYGTIVHWDGTKWTRFESGTQWPLFGIWGTGPNDVWAVGRFGTVLHWDGTSWSPQQSNTTLELVGVWGNGQGDVWATMRSERAFMHRDPAGVWSLVPYSRYVSFTGITGTAQGALWAWGSSGVYRTDQETIDLSDDITSDMSFPWWSSTLPWDRGTTTIANVWMAGPTDLWILTERGDVYNWKEDANGNITAVQSRVPPSGAAQDGYLKYTSIWGTSPSNVWASGQLGRIVHLTDTSWSLSSTAVHGRIFDCTLSLWGSSANDVWAVGKCADGQGVALRRHP